MEEKELRPIEAADTVSENETKNETQGEVLEQSSEKGQETKQESKEEYSRRVQKRIDQLTREKYEKDRRIKELERQIEILKRKSELGPRPVPPSIKAFTDEYGTIDEEGYKKALMEYEDKLYAWRQAQQEIELPTSSTPSVPSVDIPQPTIPDDFMEQVEKMKQKYPDFEEVVNRPVFTPEMRDAIFDSPHGAEIAYFLGKNQNEALRIGQLSPAQIYKEIGKLEAKFSATGKTVSGAPAPITPVEGRNVVERDLEKMPIEDYMAYERQKRIEMLKKGGI